MTREPSARNLKSILGVMAYSTSAKIAKKLAICGIKSAPRDIQMLVAVPARPYALPVRPTWVFHVRNTLTKESSTNCSALQMKNSTGPFALRSVGQATKTKGTFVRENAPQGLHHVASFV